MKKVTLVGKMMTAAAALLATSTLFAQAPSTVTIRSITHNGSGCPIGSVAQNIASDNKAFTLTFSDYIAEVGPDVSLKESRKNCQLTIDLQFPQGYQFAVATFDYRGYASLDRGVEGTQKSSYYFQGMGKTGSFSTTYRGVKDGDFQFRDTVPMESVIWSPCGASRALNINTQVRVSNRSNSRGRGLMTIDSIDGAVVHKYGLMWRRCR